ncbi:MAG: hypothetical protein NVS3B26_06290 [Mycobacteriales bacterium]
MSTTAADLGLLGLDLNGHLVGGRPAGKATWANRSSRLQSRSTLDRPIDRAGRRAAALEERRIASATQGPSR